MKLFAYWTGCILIGYTAILLLNSTEIAKMGHGLTLPFGWQNPPVQTYSNCSQEEQFTNPVKYNCAPTCTAQTKFSNSLPFSTSRPSASDFCGSDQNYIAALLNFMTGIVLGALIGLLFNLIWNQKKSK